MFVGYWRISADSGWQSPDPGCCDDRFNPPMETRRRVDWFNKRRVFGSIGRIPPAEAEVNYHAAMQDFDMVACFKPNRLRQIRRG